MIEVYEKEYDKTFQKAKLHKETEVLRVASNQLLVQLIPSS